MIVWRGENYYVYKTPEKFEVRRDFESVNTVVFGWSQDKEEAIKTAKRMESDYDI